MHAPTKRRAILPILIIAAMACAILAGAARASDLEAIAVLQDRGWHGVGGDLQAQATTVDYRAASDGVVAVWIREPLPARNGVDPYGQWLYVKWLFACREGVAVPYATIDDSDEVRLAREVLGETPPAQVPTGALAKIMRGVCAKVSP